MKILDQSVDKSLGVIESLPKSKLIFAKIYNSSSLQKMKIFSNKTHEYIMAVNYHDVQKIAEENFVFQLKYFSSKFELVDRFKLSSFLCGDWPYNKPGLMLHFDDGLCNHYEVVAPTLDKFGFTGWFHVITDHLDNVKLFSKGLYGKDSMTWAQVKNLADRGHEICSHSCSHKRFKKYLNNEEIEHEICSSFRRISQELCIEPVGFCWPGGEIDAYDIRAMKLIVATYKYAFPSYTKRIKPGVSPYALNRCNIEATWPLSAVMLSMGFLWELKHKRRANFYNKLLSGIILS